MARCDACGRDVITATYGGKLVLLDPHYRCYVAVEEDHIYPEDGDHVFLSTGVVEHAATCPQARADQARQREQGKRQYEQRQAAKRGA